MTLLFIGTTELLLIAGASLLIFGGKKIPALMKGLGKDFVFSTKSAYWF